MIGPAGFGQAPKMTAEGGVPIASVHCRCGCLAKGPQWSPKARGYVVRCSDDRCPATTQAKTKASAVDLWGQVASKF